MNDAKRDDATTSGASRRGQWLSHVGFPLGISLAALLAGLVVVLDQLGEERRARQTILEDNRLKMLSAREHVQEFFDWIFSDLAFLSFDEHITRMETNSAPAIRAFLDHQKENRRLSEVYVAPRDFDGTKPPLLTFEYNAKSGSLFEEHSLEREREEYAELVRMLSRFAAQSNLSAQVSRELRLCVIEGQDTNTMGVVCSVPVNSGPALAGLVAGMVPTRKIEAQLERGSPADMALLIGESGSIFGCLDLPASTREWFQAQASAQRLGALFQQPGQTPFAMGKWQTLWTSVDLAPGERWWLVFQYDEAAYLRASGVIGIYAGWLAALAIVAAGNVLALLVRSRQKRLLEHLDALDERHRTDEVLRASEARYRAVSDSTNDAIVTADRAGNIAGWNFGAERMFGQTKAEVIGQPLTLVMPGGYQERHREGMQRVQAGGAPRGIAQTVELEGRRKDGSAFPMEVSLTEWETAEGHFFTGIIRDITERKQAQAAREQLVVELQDALAQVKTLDRLLPICSGCKKIRDDKNYWHQVDSYLSKHTDAKFTHGMCPDCIKKYFPELEDDGA